MGRVFVWMGNLSVGSIRKGEGMMEAKETVMKRVQVNRAWKDMGLESSIPTFANYGETHPTYKLLKAQAEISFNAGRKEECARIINYIKQNCAQTEGNQGYLILDRDIKEWEL